MVTRRSSRDSAEPQGGSGWAEYVQTHLDALGWNNATLAAAARLDRSLVGRWLNEGKQPSIESVRAVAKAFHRDIREGLIAAGYFTEEEMKVSARQRPDLHLLDDDELLAEVKRRMSRRGRTGPRGPELAGRWLAERGQAGVDRERARGGEGVPSRHPRGLDRGGVLHGGGDEGLGASAAGPAPPR